VHDPPEHDELLLRLPVTVLPPGPVYEPEPCELQPAPLVQEPDPLDFQVPPRGPVPLPDREAASAIEAPAINNAVATAIV
jgi:hypothetical protein